MMFGTRAPKAEGMVEPDFAHASPMASATDRGSSLSLDPLKCLLGVYNSSTSLIKTQRAECELLD
jgi:hypothetical protein